MRSWRVSASVCVLARMCVCVCECSGTKPGATVGTGPSLLRHTGGQVEEEGASMEMTLLQQRGAALQSGKSDAVVIVISI